MEFIIGGRRYNINREQIIETVKGIAPETTDGRHKYYVEILGKHYPIKQPIHLVTGRRNIDINAAYALNILRRLGFEINDLADDIRQPVINVKTKNGVNTLKFAVTLEQDEDGFIVASCPALHGCHSQGRTREEAIVNVTEAIRGYIASMRLHGEPIPSITEVREVEVAI